MSAHSGPRSLWDRLERLLHRERLAAALGHRDLMALPVDERVERGDTLAGLSWIEAVGARIRLRCTDNQSKYRTGDALRLSNGDGTDGVAVFYESFDDRGGVLTVARDPFDRRGRVDASRPLQLDPEDTSLLSLALEALSVLRGSTGPAAGTARAVLDRSATITRSPGDVEVSRRLVAAAGGILDDSKLQALHAAVTDAPVSLVQGPPGSGKTLLLAHVTTGLARAGERLLVTAYTHRAVNNALRKIVEVDAAIRTVKAGRDSGADDLRGTGVERAQSLRRLPPPDGRPTIVGATIFALRSAWDDGAYDRVVFDEAAQIPLAYAPCALLAGRRFVLVGDHRQMGPIVRGDHDDPLATASLFEHLAEVWSPTLLTTTYRLNDGINAFPSRAFYDGRLTPSPEAATRRFRWRPGGGRFDDVLDPDRPAVLALVDHEGFRTRAEPEARVVARIAAEVIGRHGTSPGDLAVVSPYRAQLRRIRTLLRRGLTDAGLFSSLPVIDTVERIQGQEREVVVVSLSASDPEYLAGEAAKFFFSPNRLNVTLTRARTKLVVVCSPALFRAIPPALEVLERADVFRRMRDDLPAIDVTSRV